jgi:hypothetical protein
MLRLFECVTFDFTAVLVACQLYFDGCVQIHNPLKDYSVLRLYNHHFYLDRLLAQRSRGDRAL